ncbi:MAG TPA: hypothetical protein VG432_14945 [Gemmatimonadaceae bacterium]|nr:hypothetical protein [Gemmatimonadaceae bacterium]
MSRSPRRNLRLAHDALEDLLAVCERYPEARAEFVALVGEKALKDISAVYDTIARVTSRLEAAPSPAPRGEQ